MERQLEARREAEPPTTCAFTGLASPHLSSMFATAFPVGRSATASVKISTPSYLAVGHITRPCQSRDRYALLLCRSEHQIVH